MNRSVHVLTCNIHKGFSQFNRRVAVHDLRERLEEAAPDIVFLQEVQGLHRGHAARHADWPAAPQHEFLAENFWRAAVYGGNVRHARGHHGNAILSRFAVVSHFNQDVTDWRFERRGLLHCVIQPPQWAVPVHCVCAHLSLFRRSRRRQIEALADTLETLAPAPAPLIVAGDFNDWRPRGDDLLAERLNLVNVFAGPRSGQTPRSFPSAFPLLRLDRIFVRGLTVESASVHRGAAWTQLTDHAALSARLVQVAP